MSKILLLINVIWTIVRESDSLKPKYLQIKLKNADNAMFALDKCIDADRIERISSEE